MPYNFATQWVSTTRKKQIEIAISHQIGMYVHANFEAVPPYPRIHAISQFSRRS
jgi:hypothetical protein